MFVAVGVSRALPRVSAAVPQRATAAAAHRLAAPVAARPARLSSLSTTTPSPRGTAVLASRRALHAHARTTAAPAPSRPARLPSSGNTSDAAAAAVPEPLVGVSPDPMPDAPLAAAAAGEPIDWASSFHGLSTAPFDRDAAAVLLAPIDPADIEIKPDGILYLPEIKYRRILNAAFGPGGWGLAPRGELAIGDKVVTREYALVVQGRFVGQARGECPYFNGADGVATAGEGCKSNALMRCCKDLGIASELWDPRFIRDFKKQHCREVWVEHVATKKRRQIWLRKDCPPAYPYAATTGYAAKPAAAAR